MTDTPDVELTDPAAFDDALTSLTALRPQIAGAAADATAAVTEAAAVPLEPGVAASPALAALSEVTRTLTTEGRATADALAATISGLVAWRDGVGEIQADAADAVDQLGE